MRIKAIQKVLPAVMAVAISTSLVACGNVGTNQVTANTNGSQTNQVTSGTNGSQTNQETEGTNTDNSKAKESTAEFKTVNFGDQITTDFVEMTIETASTAQELLPTDTSGVYSYKADQDNETYFYITGNIKNVGGDTYDVEDMNIQMTFDGKYNYTGFIAADDGGNDFYGSDVKPFGSVKYYMYASIPDELINSYSTCKIQFAFHDNFKHDYHTDFNLYEYCYEINLTK